MKKPVLGTSLLLIITFLFADAQVQQEAKPVYFSGQVTTNHDSIRLVCVFWRDHIEGVPSAVGRIYISADKEGKFQFSLPAIEQPFRIQIADIVSNNILFNNQQIAEPGDNIYLSGTIKDQEEYADSNFMAHFSGNGSAKYECIQVLKVINDNRINNVTVDLAQKILISDSVLSVKLKLLEIFKAQLKPEIYQLIKADITGEINQAVLFSSFSDILYGKPISASVKEKRKLFHEFTSREAPASGEILGLSNSYPQFLYLKEKLELLFKYNGRSYGFKDLYNKLRNNYSGMLREKLLTNCLLNSLDMAEFFQGCDPDDFDYCLKDAGALIRTPWLKQPVENLLKTRTKGTNAFNFALPADSSGKVVSLSDLKGKVVLIDMWGYICTGCYRFAYAFHEKVYPQFKDNPDFKVVSIMLDEFADKEKYMRRLRRIEKPDYTYPAYINLYGGKGEVIARDMEKHYNISIAPFILLVDKEGKIYSSTVPFFIDNQSPNIEKLTALIKKVLAEPAL